MSPTSSPASSMAFRPAMTRERRPSRRFVFTDAGAFGDPLVGGVERLGELVVGDDRSGRAMPQP